MGISGLIPFMREQNLLVRFEFNRLYDSRVIIDGNNLYNQLCKKKSKYSPFFGGDHEELVHETKKFFKELQTCKITPIVIFDGAKSNERMESDMANYEKNWKAHYKDIESVYKSQLTDSRSTMLSKEVFVEILDEMDIKYSQSLCEADGDITAVAKVLECPVISNDSDFFIYNNDFILLKQPEHRRNNRFKSESLHEVYPNLDLTTLPLFSTLLGNDYCKKDFFKEFYDKNRKDDLEDKPAARIALVFEWLENKTLREAVEQLFQIMPEKKHEKMCDVLDHIFGILKIFPTGILQSIGYSEEKIRNFAKKRREESSNVLATIEEVVKLKSKQARPANSNTEDNSTFIEKYPGWFKEEMFAGRHGRTVASMLAAEIRPDNYPNHFISGTQRITHPIIALMNRLVTKDVLDYKPYKYFGEECEFDENGKMQSIVFGTRLVESRDIIPPENLPPFRELRDQPLNERKFIMNEALGVTPELGLELVTKPWQLFVGTILFWLKEDVKPERRSVHAYAAVFLVLKSIVDLKLEKKQTSWRTGGCRNSTEELTMDVSLEKAVSEVSDDDCDKVRKFINKNFVQRRDFKDVSLCTIEVYRMFQYCLRDLIALNKILGIVYEIPTLRFLSGTVFHNLCQKLSERDVDVDKYLEEQLENAPSLLRVFKILMNQVKKMCCQSKLRLFDKVFVPARVPQNLFFPF